MKFLSLILLFISINAAGEDFLAYQPNYSLGAGWQIGPLDKSEPYANLTVFLLKAQGEDYSTFGGLGLSFDTNGKLYFSFSPMSVAINRICVQPILNFPINGNITKLGFGVGFLFWRNKNNLINLNLKDLRTNSFTWIYFGLEWTKNSTDIRLPLNEEENRFDILSQPQTTPNIDGISLGSSYQEIKVNSFTYFSAIMGSEASQIPTLWRTDGTIAGTTKVYDFPQAENFELPELIGSYIIYRSGTDLHSFNVETNDSINLGYARSFVKAGNKALFTQSITSSSFNIMSTDGTIFGTSLISSVSSSSGDIMGQPGAFLAFGLSKVYVDIESLISFSPDPVFVHEFFESDGQSAFVPSALFLPLAPSSTYSFMATLNYSDINGILYHGVHYFNFQDEGGEVGSEVYKVLPE